PPAAGGAAGSGSARRAGRAAGPAPAADPSSGRTSLQQSGDDGVVEGNNGGDVSRETVWNGTQGSGAARPARRAPWILCATPTGRSRGATGKRSAPSATTRSSSGLSTPSGYWARPCTDSTPPAPGSHDVRTSATRPRCGCGPSRTSAPTTFS